MMKRRKQIFPAAALLAILLVSFILPASSLAASGEENDNHTDTEDYCMRAHDVTIGLSEFAAKTRTELESDIIAASDFALLIRDTANPTGLFVPITSGYSVDFSNLAEAATSSGYVVTVTLPAITLPQDSHVIFRVFVVDDLPHPRDVRYTFESASAGRALPADVTAQLPAPESILSGETVTPAAAFSPVRDGAGEWTFSGWSPESVTLSHSGVTFTGTWVWTALPVYTVSYTFVSGSSGRTLPSGVLAKLPMPSSGVAGDVITPQDSFRAYHMVEGAWRFTGWDKSSQTIAGGDLTFVGAWRWYHNNVVVTPVPAITPTPCPTPCPTTAPAATDAPAPSPEQQPPVQVLEQMPGDPPTPMANDGTGGTAQMAIATVLAALVAAQAFAIGSDLKVLKWYNAKKAARRAGA